MPRETLYSLSFLVLCFLVNSSNQNEQKFRLHSGDLMPMVGFGTYKITGTEIIKDVLDKALAAGYRLIDTAKVYKNEEDIGKALKELLPKYNLTREDIFITTKLAHSDHGSKALQALADSVKRLDVGYVDLYLIHFPGVAGLNGSDPQNAKLRDESWQQMIQGVKINLTRNIGVSNYNARQLKELLDNDHGTKPAVNQVEWHPLYHQKELQDLCKKEGVLLQAYSSLGGKGKDDLLKKPEVVKIAEKLGKSPAQILLRWALQQNIAVIPKASSKEHIENNFDLDFVIPEDDMKILDNFQPQHKYAWDPDTIV